MEIKLDNWTIKLDDLTMQFEDKSFSLEPRTMDLLVFLIKNHGKVVSRNCIVESVWDGMVVSDHSVTSCIAKLRKIFNKSGETKNVIDTISKRGYRLNAEVKIEYKSENSLSKPNIKDDPVPESNLPPEKDEHTPFIQDETNQLEKKTVSRWRIISNIILVFFTALLTYIFFTVINIEEKVRNKEILTYVKPVTALTGRELAPFVSPDSQLLGYLFQEKKGENWDLHIMDLSSLSKLFEIKNVAEYTQPAWSSDNSKVIFHRLQNEKCEIYIASIDRSLQTIEERKIIDCLPHSKEISFAWDSNNHLVYFNESSSKSDARSIFQVNINTLKTLQLTAPQKVGFGDYDQLFDSKTNSLYFLRNRYWVESTAVMRLNLENFQLDLLFNVDGLVLSHTLDNDNNVIYQTQQRQLMKRMTSSGETFELYNSALPIAQPTFSAKENAVFFVLEENQDINIGQYSLGARTEDISFINSSRDDYAPTFSNKGNKLAYISNKSGKRKIYISDLNSLKTQTIETAEDLNSSKLIWSNDDQYLVYSQKGAIIKTHLISGKIEKLRLPIEFTYISSFSQDGKSIYYSSDHESDWQLYKLTDQDVEKVTDYGGYEAIESTDGKKLYFSKFRQGGLWEKDLATGAETLIIKEVEILLQRSFQVFDDVIYYKTKVPNGFDLFRYGINDKSKTFIGRIKGEVIRGFTISPDQQMVIYEKTPSFPGADIMKAK